MKVVKLLQCFWFELLQKLFWNIFLFEQISTLATLFSLLSSKLLRVIFVKYFVVNNPRLSQDDKQKILQENKSISFVKVGKLANYEKESLENEIGVESKQTIDARTKQNRALQVCCFKIFHLFNFIF